MKTDELCQENKNEQSFTVLFGRWPMTYVAV